MSVATPSVHELQAKQAITEVIHRYCRGMDRMDRALTLSCWHPDGTDDHAPLYHGSATGFIEWLWPVHAAMVSTRHVVSNILIDLTGDTATSETYWTVTLRTLGPSGLVDIVGGGRYLDRLECIEGRWAFRHRQSVHDWDRVDPVVLTLSDPNAVPLIPPNNPDAPIALSARDSSDPSYRYLLFSASGR